MATAGEKYGSPCPGGTGSNNGYLHEFLNIEALSASMLPGSDA